MASILEPQLGYILDFLSSPMLLSLCLQDTIQAKPQHFFSEGSMTFLTVGIVLFTPDYLYHALISKCISDIASMTTRNIVICCFMSF